MSCWAKARICYHSVDVWEGGYQQDRGDVLIGWSQNIG